MLEILFVLTIGVVIAIVFVFIKFVQYLVQSSKPSPQKRATNSSELQITFSEPEPVYRRSSNTKPDAFKWIPPGMPINIQGYLVSDGMIYVGKNMSSVSGYSIEPGFINPSLKIDRMYPDREGKFLQYWPSYNDIPPASKAAYLEWLAGGRKDPNAEIGYVFLFFYGLERRLLFDTTRNNVPQDEIRSIINELQRLRDLYAPLNGSFNHYVNDLLQYFELKSIRTKYYDLIPPEHQYTYDLSPIIALALGQLALEGKPLSGEWIYHYVVNHPEIPLRTPAKRCKEEFRKLFLLRYQQKFNDGIVVKPNKTKIKIGYHCASSGFSGNSYNIPTDIPDVATLKGIKNKVAPIVEECQNDLDKFSRWVGQNPNATDSLQAYTLLPDDLTPSISFNSVDKVKEWILWYLKSTEFVVFDNKDLTQVWPVKTPGKMTKAETLSFITLLRKTGFGIEPDVRFNGISIKSPGTSVIFKTNGADLSESTVSPFYSGRLLLLHLVTSVAKADGVIEDGERKFLKEFIHNATQITLAEKTRMEGHLLWLLNSKDTTQGLKKRIEKLDENQKKQCADYLVTIAGADGYICPAEVKMLTKLYKLLGLSPEELYSDIHRFQTNNEKSIDEPVSVKPADVDSSGYQIPKPSQPEGFKLDTQKIKERLQETAEVSEILSTVFEDANQDAEPQEFEELPVIEDEKPLSLHGLDDGHSALLYAFQKQKVWSRKEFERITQIQNLLPDGALDVLNEVALEVCDEVLCEGEDPIEINQEVLEELTA